MRLLLLAVTIITLFSCKKSNTDGPITCWVGPEPTWITAKKAEFKNCDICNIIFQLGAYDNKQVLEIKIDPMSAAYCDGINTVYNIDGTILLSSTDQQAYIRYVQEVKEKFTYWSCKSGQ